MEINALAASMRGISTTPVRSVGTIAQNFVFSTLFGGVTDVGDGRSSAPAIRTDHDDEGISLVDITCSESVEFKKLWLLYNTAFGQDERRSLLEHERAHNDSRFHFSAIRCDGRTAGLLAYWELNDMLFVEHFAVDPEFRSKGIGSRVIETLQYDADRMIVLDVEPEQSSTDAFRRVHFYRRHGFRYCRESVMLPIYWFAKPVLSNLMVWTPNHVKLTQKQMLACIRRGIYRTDSGYKRRCRSVSLDRAEAVGSRSV